jgi:2,4-dienoyl-CoA reductase (NADPH2)
VKCAVNPVTAHEATLASAERKKTAHPRRILIVGGGPAGLEAARVASLRGHEVVLCEKTAQLGGTLRFAALVYEPNERLLDWLEGQVRQLAIEIRLNTEVTGDVVREISPDEILVAVGASRAKPVVRGVNLSHVFDGDDLRALLTGQDDRDAAQKLSLLERIAVRAGRATGITTSPGRLREASRAFMPVGSKVVIVGGGLVGLELAEFLAERGREVVVLEEGPKFGLEMAHPRRWRAIFDLRQHGVELVANATLRSIDECNVDYQIEVADQDVRLCHAEADTVILATGLGPDPTASKHLAETGVPIREIGDVSGPGYLEGAIHDGFRAALEL